MSKRTPEGLGQWDEREDPPQVDQLGERTGLRKGPDPWSERRRH